MIGLVYLLSLQERRDATVEKLRAKIENADLYVDVSEPSPTIVDALPAECPESDVRDAVVDLPAGESWIDICGLPFVAYVGEHEEARVTAVVGFIDQEEETERLARLALFAGLLGVMAAAGIGWLFGRRAVRPLGEALASQRRFIAEASHELRTPLAIVMTRAQLLERGPLSDDDQRRDLQQLVRDARVANEVVSDLLLVAELQHRPPQREPVDLTMVAEEVRDSFRTTADLAGAKLEVQAPPEDGYVVLGVPRALRRAVAALVDNALDHVAEDGYVGLELSRAADVVHLSVTDNGTGLDPATAAELTARFRRGTGGVDGRHLGLGLALVNEIAGAHGGALAIEGELGVGARITLQLPAPGRELIEPDGSGDGRGTIERLHRQSGVAR
ncbi:HAMP domain-containing sensor histidine kinase [Nocardioides sp. NPDC023903]|uniref:sensor histidine kinase n=1 Tax=Nocardioides sp. NPDC023903 TaxID=3157195 RepID=UPI0033C0B86C